MKITKIEDECQPPGAEMCFLQEDPPEGWKWIRQKSVNTIPKAARGAIVILCEKEY